MDEENEIWKYDISIKQPFKHYTIETSDGTNWVNVGQKRIDELEEENRLLKIKLERLQKLFNIQNNDL